MTRAPSEGSVRASAGKARALLAVCAVVPFLLSLGNGFVFDDIGLIVENPSVLSSGPGPAWSQPYWPDRAATGLYRPLTTFTYWIENRIFGLHAAPFHAVNLLLHLGCTLLLFSTLTHLFPSRRRAAWWAALVFALHPLHAEAVVWAVGRSELLAAFWGILAYRLALSVPEAASRGPRGGPILPLAGSALALFLALCSKESSFGLVLLPLAHLFVLPSGEGPDGQSSKPGWRSLSLVWTLPVFAAALLRLRILGGLLGLAPVSLSDNVLAHVPAWERIFSALGFQWILLQRLVVPLGYSVDHSYPQLVPGYLWSAAGALLLALALWGTVRAWTRRDREVLWGIAFVAAAGLLTSNILFPIGTVLAERLAYLPTAGVLWIGSVLLDRLLSRTSPGRLRAARVVGVLWMVLLAAAGVARTREWKSDRTLFTAALRTSPRSAKVHTNLAVVLSREEEMDRSLEESALALRLLPDYPPALEAHGTALAKAGRAGEAVPYLMRAARLLERKGEAYLRLGNAYLDLHRPAAADSAFEAARRDLSPRDRRLLIGLASARAQLGRWEESRDFWRRAAALPPVESSVRGNWAFALWQAGSPDSAEAVYRLALRDDPESPNAMNDLAWFLAQSGRNPEEGVHLARAAFRLRPDANTADTLFEALLAADGCARTRSWVDSLGRAEDLPGRALADGLRERLRQRCEGK